MVASIAPDQFVLFSLSELRGRTTHLRPKLVPAPHRPPGHGEKRSGIIPQPPTPSIPDQCSTSRPLAIPPISLPALSPETRAQPSFVCRQQNLSRHRATRSVAALPLMLTSSAVWHRVAKPVRATGESRILVRHRSATQRSRPTAVRLRSTGCVNRD